MNLSISVFKEKEKEKVCDMDIIMANIERYREAAGMTKEEFAKKLGISCSKYEQYLAKEIHIITSEVFRAANILHVKVSDILMPKLD